MARTPHTEASVLCIFGCPKFPRIMVSFFCGGSLYAMRSTAMEWPTCTAFWVQCKQWNGQHARPFGCSASNGVVQFARLWMRCSNEVVPTNLIYFFIQREYFVHMYSVLPLQEYIPLLECTTCSTEDCILPMYSMSLVSEKEPAILG